LEDTALTWEAVVGVDLGDIGVLDEYTRDLCGIKVFLRRRNDIVTDVGIGP